MNKYLTIFLSLVIVALFSSCKNDTENLASGSSFDKKEANKGEALMQDEVEIGTMATYTDIAENESESMDRSFENAPPFIPHTVKGMMVITKSQNVCLNCHRPEKAEAENATPMPVTHFTDYRPEIIEKDGLYAVNTKEGEVTAISTHKEVNMAQYNCNQCHVALTNATVMIRNTFKPVFRSSKDKNRSNLVDNMAEGVK